MGTVEPDEQREEVDPRTRLRENATGIASMLVTGIWLAAMFTGQSWWLAALLFGYIVVVPTVALLFGDEEDRREWWDEWSADAETAGAGETDDESGAAAENGRDALETLRERYAAGDLTDEQFERKLERLLETETLEDAQERVRERRDGNAGRNRNENVEYER